MIIYSSVKSILGSTYPAFLFGDYEQLKQNLEHYSNAVSFKELFYFKVPR